MKDYVLINQNKYLVEFFSRNEKNFWRSLINTACKKFSNSTVDVILSECEGPFRYYVPKIAESRFTGRHFPLCYKCLRVTFSKNGK